MPRIMSQNNFQDQGRIFPQKASIIVGQIFQKERFAMVSSHHRFNKLSVTFFLEGL